MEPARVRLVTFGRRVAGREEADGGSRNRSGAWRGVLAPLLVAAVLTACGGHEGALAPISPPGETNELDDSDAPGAGLIPPTPIAVTTYDGSGQLVHPDAAVFPRRWQGKRYWVSATPYPAGNPRLENPSIYHGRSSSEMSVPPGVTNPLALPPVSGYLSDPDLLYDAERDELRMYYRSTSGPEDELRLMTSADGVSWSRPTPVLKGPRFTLISPAIVREGASSWRMWTINAAAQGCYASESEVSLEQRRSADGISWGPAQPVSLTIPGRVPWHWDVQYVPAKAEYWALIAAYPEGTTCSHTAVYFAQSTDGTTWTAAPVPLLGPGETASMRDLVYRSSFRYHDGSDAVSVWFSGARLDGAAFVYGVASARYPYADLLRRVSGRSPALFERQGDASASPELRAARESFERHFP